MSILILAIALIVIGAFMLAISCPDLDDVFPVLGCIVAIVAGACMVTSYCTTECHQDIIDKAGYELDLREESKEVEK